LQRSLHWFLYNS